MLELRTKEMVSMCVLDSIENVKPINQFLFGITAHSDNLSILTIKEHDKCFFNFIL